MKFSDEMLMAYADGELDLVSRAEIESAMATDPRSSAPSSGIARCARACTSAYGSVLQEPIPMKLSSLVTPKVAAPVVDLAAGAARTSRSAAGGCRRSAGRCRNGARWRPPWCSDSSSACW